MIKIYADFNNCDEQQRVRLNTVGSLEDIEKNKHALRDGLKVILYMTGEFEVQGTLVFDGGIWNGIPEWATIRYEDTEDAPEQK